MDEFKKELNRMFMLARNKKMFVKFDIKAHSSELFESAYLVDEPGLKNKNHEIALIQCQQTLLEKMANVSSDMLLKTNSMTTDMGNITKAAKQSTGLSE